VKRSGAAAILSLLAVLLIAGCGQKHRVGDRIPGRTLTVYASAPLHGDSSTAAQAVLAGERLALARIRGRIGRYRIVLQALDDSTLPRGNWDPAQTTANALIAARDPTTVGYLGELGSGASAVSIPVLSRVGIAQGSPASRAAGLTPAGPGAAPGEPDKYYPTGVRKYARVIPNDSAQAAAQVRIQQRLGCETTFVLDDGEVDGEDTAITFALVAQSAGLRVAGIQPFDPAATDYRPLVASVGQTGARCVLISAVSESRAAVLATQIASGLPSARIFTSAATADSAFVRALPAARDRRVLITAPAASPATARAAGPLRPRGGLASATGQRPYESYGYEAMGLLLDAIARATKNGTRAVDRSRVVAAIFATRKRRGVLGTYGIDREGDPTIRRYGIYRIIAGRLSLWQTINV